MGLPVPQVFLYVNDDDQLEIIDGQQRIMSVKYFFGGYFGEPDQSDKQQVFRLKGLSERSEYNGKTFSELSQRDQRRLKNTSLRAIHIKQLKPSLRNDSVFYIFERLNTGGTQLKPQEIRNAVFRGNIVEKLNSLNSDTNWRTILGASKPDKNQKDIEIILRLFSLFETWERYEKPMLRYLNTQMKDNKEFNSERANRFSNRFPEVVKVICATVQNPFRPRKVINVALLEGVVLALLEDSSINAKRLRVGYEALEKDEIMTNLVRGPTTDTLILQKRIRRAKEILGNAQG
jgi:uncharacterized protein with ParB-like and HNH nuclease domain